MKNLVSLRPKLAPELEAIVRKQNPAGSEIREGSLNAGEVNNTSISLSQGSQPMKKL